MEAELKELGEQVASIRSASSEQVNQEKRHIETLHSHEKVLKSKVSYKLARAYWFGICSQHMIHINA